MKETIHAIFWIVLAGLVVIFAAENAVAAPTTPLCEKVEKLKELQIGTETSKTIGMTISFINLGYYNESCQLKEIQYRNKLGSYTLFITFDDDCDGGNTYGYIEDSEGAQIGQIRDSEVWCNGEL